jgi:hypothetical protein
VEPKLRRIYETQLLPSVIEFYGCRANPWKLDGQPGEFLLDNLAEEVMQRNGREWDRNPSSRIRRIVSAIVGCLSALSK